MMLVYSSTVIVAYAALGHSVPGFLPDALSHGPARQVVGVMLTFHIIVAYVITAQPLHRFLHATFFPRTLDAAGCEAKLHWALISLGYLLVCFILGNSIPFFADMQARTPNRQWCLHTRPSCPRNCARPSIGEHACPMPAGAPVTHITHATYVGTRGARGT
jgi:hypothetical protein